MNNKLWQEWRRFHVIKECGWMQLQRDMIAIYCYHLLWISLTNGSTADRRTCIFLGRCIQLQLQVLEIGCVRVDSLSRLYEQRCLDFGWILNHELALTFAINCFKLFTLLRSTGCNEWPVIKSDAASQLTIPDVIMSKASETCKTNYEFQFTASY